MIAHPFATNPTRSLSMPGLFDPIRIGDIALANRVVMAPLTRNRAIAGNKPGPLTVEYYRQRASAGLIISEASQISPMAQGYLDTPGIYSDEQIAAWRQVTTAVHADGGRMVIQLWHVGRISHTSLLPDGAAPTSAEANTSSEPMRSRRLRGGGKYSSSSVIRTSSTPWRGASRAITDSTSSSGADAPAVTPTVPARSSGISAASFTRNTSGQPAARASFSNARVFEEFALPITTTASASRAMRSSAL